MNNGCTLRGFLCPSFLSAAAGFLKSRIQKVSLLTLLAALFAPNVFAEANYVYHERTTANPGCGGQYVSVLNPTSAQAYDLRIKVEYQFSADNVRVYYTTNGSTPGGTMGSGNVGTLVVPGSFVCTFGGGPVVDVWSATIPAQPVGTVVKYIVSAWHSGGGAEIFGNGPGASCSCGTPTTSSAQATVHQYTVASTTDLYWDINGATAGAGGATPTGTWNSGTPWSPVFDGTAATVAWTSGRNAIFSAGTDATGAFTVTTTAPQTVAGLTVEEGIVSLAGNAVTNAGAAPMTILVKNGATLSADSSLRISASSGSGSTITLDGGTWRTTNPSAAGSFADTDFTITLTAAGGTFSHTTANILNIVQDGSAPAVVRVTGPGGLTKTGVGVLAFAALTDYQGPTVINEGEVRIRTTANRLPVTTDITINSPGILNLNNVSQRVGSIAGNGSIGTGGGTLTVSGAVSTVLSGVLKNITNAGAAGVTTGNGRLIKDGAGVITFEGLNDINGSVTLTAGGINVSPSASLCGPIADLTVNGGTLNLSNTLQQVENLSSTLAAGTINLGPGHTLRTDPIASTTFSGMLAGPGGLTKSNLLSGGTMRTLTLTGPNTFDGNTFVGGGNISVGSATALGSTVGHTEVASGAEIIFTGAGTTFTCAEPFRLGGLGGSDNGAIAVLASASPTISGPITLTADAQITVSSSASATFNNPNAITSLANQNLTIRGGANASGVKAITGVINLGSGGITKLEGGEWILSGDNVYGGGTFINAGTLRVANTTGSATGSGAVTVAAGATLKGPGSAAGTVTVDGTISPGTSPGTINTGSETWSTNGTYVWEINDVDAGMGTDPGWDLINITGSLTINATPANKFNINIRSLALANTNGPVHDFDNTTDYSWTILKTTTGITGFDPASFTLNSAGFSNALGDGVFIIETANAGNDLVLRFVRGPGIAVQPVGGTAECSSNFTFTVSATGTAPLSYQWMHAGTNLPGATADMLTVTATPDTAGNYVVVVSNAYGTTNSAVAVLVVQDTTPPAINCGQNETVTCQQGWGYTVPIVIDNCDGLISGNATPLSTDTNFGCGYTFVATRVWQVSDSSGNTAYCTQVVSLVDFTPPTITCPSNITVQCLDQVPPPDISSVTAATQPFEICETNAPVVTHVSDVTNGMGTVVMRTYRATDACSNSIQCVQTITVQDTLAPQITCPTNITVQCVSNVPPCPTNLMEFLAQGGTASDNCNSNFTFSCSDGPLTGGNCGGTITRTHTVTDGSSNSASCQQIITVNDTTPPSITCPSNVVVNIAVGETNAVANYPPPDVTDTCSTATSNCVPASGSTFPVGTTTVTCTATDVCSNVSTCMFTVTVSSAPVAGADTMGALQNHPAMVTAAKLLANDTSPGGYPLSVTAVSPTSTNGGLVVLSMGVVTYTPALNFTGTDAFTYTVEDDQGGSSTGQVTVIVRSASDPSQNLVSVTVHVGSTAVVFAGIPGRSYVIERSEDLVTWVPLGGATAQEHGQIEFTDVSPPSGAAFYRTVVP